MVGMEINSGTPFDPSNQTVTQLISWLQGQDPNSRVHLKGGGTLVFRRLRLSEGGGIEVEAVSEAPRRRPKSKTEQALEKAQVSRTDSPAEAERVVADAKRQTGPAGRTALDEDRETKANQEKQEKEHEDSILGENKGHDQGGVVPGTSKTPSDKIENEKGSTRNS